MPFTYPCTHCGTPVVREARFGPGIKGREKPYCSPACYHADTDKRKWRNCDQCGKRYRQGGRDNKRFCSKDCWYAAKASRRVDKVCRLCGKTFSVTRASADRYTVCSMECKRLHMHMVTCKHCGKAFNAGKVNGTPNIRHYCSRACEKAAGYRTCKHCGKTFYSGPSSVQIFCDFACWRRYTGETTIEAAVREALGALGVAFEQEAKVGRSSVDFLLSDRAIALEVDGEYWHRNSERDARKNAMLQQHGLTVLRISETQIRNHPNLPALVAHVLAASTASRH